MLCMVIALMITGCKKSTKEVNNIKQSETVTSTSETNKKMELQKEENGYVQPLTELSQLTEWKNDKEHTEYSEVWFGSYPNHECTRCNTSETLWNQLVQADYDQNDTTTVDDTRYQRVEIENRYRYFKYEPLKWRVLESDTDKIMLLADDAIYFMKQDAETKWNKSAVRSWLNGLSSNENNDNVDYTQNNFLQQAFSEEEASVLLDLSTVSELHEQSGIKATLAYFPGGKRSTVFEQFYMNLCSSTEFAYALGVNRQGTELRSTPNCSWMIRSKQEGEEKIAEVIFAGRMDKLGVEAGVRPLICLDTSTALQNSVCGIAGKSSAVEENRIESVVAFRTEGVDEKELEYEDADRKKLNSIAYELKSTLENYFANKYDGEDEFEKFKKSKKDENGLVVCTYEDIVKIYEDDAELAGAFINMDLLEQLKECDNGTGWSSAKSKNQKLYLMYDENYEYFTVAGKSYGAWFAKVGEIFSSVEMH